MARDDLVVQKVLRILTDGIWFQAQPTHHQFVNALPVVFLVAFVAGLVLAVLAMLHGVEHTRRNKSRAPSPFFNLPALAAFAVAFGAVGYPIASRTTLPVWVTLLIAAASGGLAISAMVTLLARWALRGASAQSAAMEHEIQGHLAVVTVRITSVSRGEIAYQLPGREVRIPAKTLSLKSAAQPATTTNDESASGVPVRPAIRIPGVAIRRPEQKYF